MSNKILNWNEIRRVRVSRVLCFEGFPRETPKPALATSCSKSPRWWSWSLPPTLTAPAVAASPTSSLPSPCPLGSLPSQVPPSSPRRERSPHGSGPRSHSQCPDQGQAGESAPAMRPPTPLLRQGQHHLPGVGAVLAQPAGSSTTNRVGFGERREGHVEAGPEASTAGLASATIACPRGKVPEQEAGCSRRTGWFLPRFHPRAAGRTLRPGVQAEEVEASVGLTVW